jgi:hypothetical protein
VREIIKPNIERLPDFPSNIPWSPNARDVHANDFIDDNSNLRAADGQLLEVAEYADAASSRFVIPNHASDALSDAFSAINHDFLKHIFANTGEASHYASITDFEQNILGLPATSAIDGLRYYATSSGFASGTYPIEPFSRLLRMDAINTKELFRKSTESEHGLFSIVLDDFLLDSVSYYQQQADILKISGINKLTSIGKTFVDTVLRAYSAGIVQGITQH